MNEITLEEALEQIKNLEKQVISLKSQLATANKTLDQYRNYSQRKYRDDYDYVPYQEDEHGRE